MRLVNPASSAPDGSRTAGAFRDAFIMISRSFLGEQQREGTRRERFLYKRQCVGPSARETVTKGISPHTLRTVFEKVFYTEMRGAVCL